MNFLRTIHPVLKVNENFSLVQLDFYCLHSYSFGSLYFSVVINIVTIFDSPHSNIKVIKRIRLNTGDFGAIKQ